MYGFIKVLSTCLITGAIGLELWTLKATLTDSWIASIPEPVFWLERFAIAIHLLEGGVAAAYAPSRNKPALRYGTYTFFVGTVGLLELFKHTVETP